MSVSYWMRRENFFQSRFTSYVIPSNPQFAPYFATLEKLGIEGRKADAVVYEMVQNQAFTVTFLEMCYISALLFIALLLLLLCFRSRKAALAHAEKLAK